jgi:hypothetical protein
VEQIGAVPSRFVTLCALWHLQLLADMGKLERSGTAKKRTTIDQKEFITSRLREVDGQLSKMRMWLKRNGKV